VSEGVHPAAPTHVSRRKICLKLLIPTVGLAANDDENTMYRPFALMEAVWLPESASVKSVVTLDRSTTPTASAATGLIVKDTTPEVPPPGPVLKTLTRALPGCTRSAIGIAVLRSERLRAVEARSLPFHCMIVAATKPEPWMRRGIPGQPAGALVADNEESTGRGLLVKGSMMNVLGLEFPPPGAGFDTLTCALPAAAKSLAKTGITSWDELSVAGRATPFHCTVEESKKPVPDTFKLIGAEPACAWVGARTLIVGSG
jgi:hypothetical protein